MKKSILLVITFFLLGISGLALAAGNNRRPVVPGRPGRNVQQPMQRRESAFDKLNLTEKQKTRIKEIRKDFAIKAERIRKSNLSDKQKRERLTNLNKEMQSKINSVLTPKQQEIRAAAIKQAGKRGNHRGEGIGATALRFRKELKLSANQIKQIEKINNESNKRIRILLSGTEKNRGMIRNKIQNIQNESKERIMKILTPEQHRKLEQLRKNAGFRRERERKGAYLRRA